MRIANLIVSVVCILAGGCHGAIQIPGSTKLLLAEHVEIERQMGNSAQRWAQSANRATGQVVIDARSRTRAQQGERYLKLQTEADAQLSTAKDSAARGAVLETFAQDLRALDANTKAVNDGLNERAGRVNDSVDAMNAAYDALCKTGVKIDAYVNAGNFDSRRESKLQQQTRDAREKLEMAIEAVEKAVGELESYAAPPAH